MPYYKVSLLINNTGTKDVYGWSEVFIINQPDDATALDKAKAIADARLQFLAPPNYILGVRVGLIGPTGVARKSPLTGFRLLTSSIQVCGTELLAQSTGLYTAEPGSAILYRCFARPATGKVSSRRWRGFPSSWWITQGRLNVPLADGTIQKFAKLLFALGWVKLTVNQTTGAITPQTYYCIEFRRMTTKRTGRPFADRRGRKFSHRR
jgi:hypothetical protein